MLFVLPTTPALHPSSYLTPQPYPYSNKNFYNICPNGPRFGVAPLPTSQQPFFRQPSAEELEEREYERALAVIYNYRLRHAEKEAVTRRQQQAEAARQRYLAQSGNELEQQRQQEELLAARRAETLRMQQARARLAAAERQIAVNEMLRRPKATQQVCCTCIPIG